MKRYDKFPFNHFMLWCRGWYDWDEKLSIYHQARKAFELDGYLPKNDAYRLSIIALEELCEYLNIPLKLSTFINELRNFEKIHSTDIATILAVKSYLRFIDLDNAKHDLIIAKEGLNGLKHYSDEETINRVFGEKRDEPYLYDEL